MQQQPVQSALMNMGGMMRALSVPHAPIFYQGMGTPYNFSGMQFNPLFQQPPLACFNCNQAGHFATNCPLPQRTPRRRDGPMGPERRNDPRNIGKGNAN